MSNTLLVSLIIVLSLVAWGWIAFSYWLWDEVLYKYTSEYVATIGVPLTLLGIPLLAIAIVTDLWK